MQQAEVMNKPRVPKQCTVASAATITIHTASLQGRHGTNVTAQA
jgi:hypothetical protein